MMFELIKDFFRYFLSESFDDDIKQIASPTKVAFLAGFAFGGLSVLLYQQYQYKWNRAKSEMKQMLRGTIIQPRNGTFEENRIEVNNILESLIISGDRFNSLKQYLRCTEGNNLEDLMSNFSNERYKDELGIAYFFAKVAEFLRGERGIELNRRVEYDNSVIELTRLCFEKDVLLMFSEKDSNIADDIKKFMEEMNISVDLDSEVGIGKTVLSILSSGFKRYMFIFFIATQNLQNDGIKDFLVGGQLVISLRDNHSRLIPVKIAGDTFDCPVFGQFNPWVYKTDKSRRTLEAVIQATTDKVFSL